MTARAKRPTTKPPPVPARARAPRDSQAEVPTEVYDPDRLAKAKADVAAKAPAAKAPAIQAISMKTPGGDKLAVDLMRAEPTLKRPKLRAISEVTPPSAMPATNLGYLAPPRDPAEVRSRRRRELVVLGSLSVIIASVVALVIWFLAR